MKTETLYRIPPHLLAEGEYAYVGPALLRLIDYRGKGANPICKYAPITGDGPHDIDNSLAFEDVWGDVEPVIPGR